MLASVAVPAQSQNTLTVVPARFYDTDGAGGAAGPARTLVVRNGGNTPITLTGIQVSGEQAAQFIAGTPPGLPRTLGAGDTLQLTLRFAPTSEGLKTAVLTLAANTGNLALPLRGLGTTGGNAPSLQAICNLLEIGVTIGDDQVGTTIINSDPAFQRAPLLGEELPAQGFRKAGAGPVSIEPLAVFGPSTRNPVVAAGWYRSGQREGRTELFTVSNQPTTNASTVQVPAVGSTAFDPGDTAFGFFSRWPHFDNRILYSEDSLNSFEGAIPHHVRVYPYRRLGVAEANAYLVAFEENTSGFDYQDLVFVVRNVVPVGSSGSGGLTLTPLADAYVNGGNRNTNFGADSLLLVRGTTTGSDIRRSHLRFALPQNGPIQKATLRLYGRNTSSNATTQVYVSGLDTAVWTEAGISYATAPGIGNVAVGSIPVGPQAQYYELDVTAYVRTQQSRSRNAVFVLRDTLTQNLLFSFFSKESSSFPPQLVVQQVADVTKGKGLLAAENLDRFPSNQHFVTSRIQVPWRRGNGPFNSNHDTVKLRLHNKGSEPLTVQGLRLSAPQRWKYLTMAGNDFDTTAFPFSINPGAHADFTLQFVAVDNQTEEFTQIFHDSLTVISNDSEQPAKLLHLMGLWQKQGEDKYEPTAQRTIDAFGFRTRVGFSAKDPDVGAPSKPKGDEILTSFFVRADSLKPVTVRQMSAYHGCCTQTETFRWYPKGSIQTLNSLFTHIGLDAQSLLPRRNVQGAPAEGSFNPATPFGIRISTKDHMDTLANPDQKIGIRVWKAIDANGDIIPNCYIVANDYLDTEFTNYDYNDNMYFITNVRPELGALNYALLEPAPSAIDFGEKQTSSTSTFSLKLKSSGKTYADGSADPTITIRSVSIVGENKDEFAAGQPAKTSLAPQDSTTVEVRFLPRTEGLKTAVLLVQYNNSQSPLRVPLYGIAKDAGTTVVVHYRIKSGSSTALTLNGKTWLPDTDFAFDNLEPYRNRNVQEISGTDEDELYLLEQSSDGDKRPFRYQLPLDSNGTYALRLHFSEVYWGAPGNGLTGGVGSRIMDVQAEGSTVIANLDIVQEAGVAAALVRQVQASVADSKLDLLFTASVNRPSLSAVEVYSFKRAAVPPPPDTVVTNPPPVDTTITTPLRQLKLYPNPNNGSFTAAFALEQGQSVLFCVTDASGRRQTIERYAARRGTNSRQLQLERFRLKPGTYFLELYFEDGKRVVQKFVLQ